MGQTVSQYEVLGILGGCDMGAVYRAEDTPLGHAVALRFLPGPFGDRISMERFHTEARIASATFNQPNICSVFSAASNSYSWWTMKRTLVLSDVIS